MQTLQLIITCDLQTGQVSVTGPLDNKVMAYGMLAAAHDAIYDYCRTQAENRIQPAPADFKL